MKIGCTWADITCTAKALSYSPGGNLTLAQEKIIWKFTLVSSHLSLLAVLPVDSCASSASLIRKQGRPTAMIVQCKLYDIKVMPTCKCQTYKNKNVNTFPLSAGRCSANVWIACAHLHVCVRLVSSVILCVTSHSGGT